MDFINAMRLHHPTKIITLLVQRAESLTGFTAQDIMAGTSHHLATIRHIIWYVLREHGLSYPVIAKQFNNRNTSTILHGVKKTGNLIGIDTEVSELYHALRDGDTNNK